MSREFCFSFREAVISRWMAETAGCRPIRNNAQDLHIRHARKKQYDRNKLYSFTNCPTDTIHKIVSVRSACRFVLAALNAPGTGKKSQ
jgi:hypothetical protein